jgi:hypothetical protein
MLEIRGNMGQCKSEHQGFEKAKERTWDSTSLRAKTSWDSASLRKAMLKNRKEARF